MSIEIGIKQQHSDRPILQADLVLSPGLVVLLVVIGNSRGVMGKNKLGLVTHVGLSAAALVMFGASGLIFYGWATGQGGG